MAFYNPPTKLWREASARRVPEQMAPESCVTYDDCVAPDCVSLVGSDLSGRVRIRVVLSRDDASTWWVRVIRHWLAWRYDAAEIRLVK
jgi:hypothetical protein